MPRMLVDAGPTPVLTRRQTRTHQGGRHLPQPRLVDHRWACVCGLLLTRYRVDGVVRLRHHPRGRSVAVARSSAALRGLGHGGRRR